MGFKLNDISEIYTPKIRGKKTTETSNEKPGEDKQSNEKPKDSSEDTDDDGDEDEEVSLN